MRHRYLLVFVAVVAVVGLTAALLLTRAHRPGQPAAGPTASPSAITSSPGHGNLTPAPSPSQPAPSPNRSASPSPSRATPTPGATLPERLLGKDIEAIPTSRRVVALTFDAGANAAGLPAILATLAAHRVSATFFLIGDFAARYPASVRAIVAGGHRIANHSTTHPYFTTLTDAAIRDQLSQARAAIRAAGGTDPRPLFRFPYGDRYARTIAAVNSGGYVCVRWTVDTLGWNGTTGGITAATVVSRVMAAARPGGIVLMHIGANPDDHTTLDADALPTVLTRLAAAGYGFVTLDALL